MATVTSMTATKIQALHDALVADLALKADLVSGKIPDSQIASNVVRAGDLVINVQDSGAIGDGITDDAAAIQAALDSAPPGSTVFLAKKYKVGAPLKIPPQVRLMGRHGSHVDQNTNPTLIVSATFSGTTGVIVVNDQATGGTTGAYSTVSCEQRIEDITIDMSALSGATNIDGVYAVGNVRGVYINNVGVWHPTNHGLNIASNGSGVPSSWRVNRLHVVAPAGIGINATMTDTTWNDCEVLGGASHGWFIGASTNCVFQGCRAEWNAFDGFNFGVGSGTGAGSGGPIFVGCSTDRNTRNGVSIPSAVNGNAPISFTGCAFRRDGAGSTSSGYSAVNINATTQPIVLNGCQVYPGTDDGGGGNASPQYGLSATSATVQINGGIWHAISEGIHDGGSNVRLSRGVNVFERTGNTSAPVVVARGVQTNGTNGANLDVPGYLAGTVTPAGHGAVAWTADPAITTYTVTPSNGTVYLSAVYVATTFTATKLFWKVATAGATPTAGQNYIGIYNSAGTRVASVGVDGRVTAVGSYTETINVTLTPGLYWIAFVFNGTTNPQLKSSTGGIAADAGWINFNLAAAAMRFATNGTGQTSLPATITPGSNSAASFAMWAAIAP